MIVANEGIVKMCTYFYYRLLWLILYDFDGTQLYTIANQMSIYLFQPIFYLYLQVICNDSEFRIRKQSLWWRQSSESKYWLMAMLITAECSSRYLNAPNSMKCLLFFIAIHSHHYTTRKTPYRLERKWNFRHPKNGEYWRT